MSASRDWDAVTYDRISDIQMRWALEQLERLDLSDGDVVLDAGCGSGRVTALLADRVRNGRVYGVDVAPSMAKHAQEALGDRATILCQDLVELDLPEPVDTAFSNATFHWVHDHNRLFARLYAEGRIEGLRTAYATITKVLILGLLPAAVGMIDKYPNEVSRREDRVLMHFRDAHGHQTKTEHRDSTNKG